MSPHCSKYVIPNNQRKFKIYALILYTPSQRSGGEEEANYLENSLNEAGWNVIKLEWLNTVELHNLIDSSLSLIVSSCSLLLVCLMSHGSRGSVIGSEGKEKPVNDIIHQLDRLLPKSIPQVRTHYIIDLPTKLISLCQLTSIWPFRYIS